jgi:hypothetical protein
MENVIPAVLDLACQQACPIPFFIAEQYGLLSNAAMASRASAANEKLRSLQRKYSQLAREEAKLEKKRSDLLLKNAILTALCEALALLQRTGMVGAAAVASDDQPPTPPGEDAK